MILYFHHTTQGLKTWVPEVGVEPTRVASYDFESYACNQFRHSGFISRYNIESSIENQTLLPVLPRPLHELVETDVGSGMCEDEDDEPEENYQFVIYVLRRIP